MSLAERSPTEAPLLDAVALQSNLRRSRRRANLLLSLLVLMGFCGTAWLGTGAIKLVLLHRGLPIASTSEEEITPIEIVEGLIAIPIVMILVVSAVVWFFWLHRAYANLRLVGLRSATYSTRWAIGCWFVPFANLFLPYRVMVDLTLRSEDGNTWHHGEDSPGPGRVLAWWLLTFLTRVLDRVVYRAPDFLDLSPVALTMADIASTLASLVWTALCFLIVRHIRDTQDRWPMTVEPQLEPAAV